MLRFRSIILSVFILSSFQHELLSQDWSFGIQASSVLSYQTHRLKSVQTISDYAHGPLLSYSFKGYIGKDFGQKWFISIEPGYIRKGEKPINDSEDQWMFFDYSQLLLMGHYSLSERFFLSFGPEISYLHQVRAKSSGGVNVISSGLYDKPFEFSGNIGIGYVICPFADLELRYSYSLTSYQEFVFINMYGEEVGTLKRNNMYWELLFRVKI